jgi:hypothetical protein
VTGDYHHFDNLQPSSSFQEVRTASGESHEVRGSGPSTVKTQTKEIKLANVCAKSQKKPHIYGDHY